MRRQITKKIIAVALAVLLVLCTSLTASAVTNSGLTFNLVSDNVVVKYGPTAGDVNNDVKNWSTQKIYITNDTTFNTFWISFLDGYSSKPPPNSRYWVIMIPFSINCPDSYGTITLHLRAYNGQEPFSASSFNGMFNYSNEKLGTFEIIDDYNARIKYTGAIPKTGYIQYKLDTGNGAGDYFGTEFTLIYDVSDALDREEEKADSSGNDSIDGITNALPNVDFGGLQNGVKSVADAMSYSGTDCVWQFPALKVPAIKNVTPEISLTSAKNIDLGAEVRKIPSPIMAILQSLCSIAIVLFVVYEMYSFIIFCLTLRNNQAGKDEEAED